MKILSLDIGIKNLAFCLFEKTNESDYFSIKQWDSIDLTEETDVSFCEFIDTSKPCDKRCTKPAKYTTSDNKCFCLKHSKKQNTFFIPTAELNVSSLKKQKFQAVLDIADKYNIAYQKPIKKGELIAIVEAYVYKNCLKEIVSKNASKIDLITIGKNIKTKFNRSFLNEGKIDHVIIENQISPIANRMKTLQGMIAQYFIMQDITQIVFVSAANKLKGHQDIETDLSTYAARKKEGINITLKILNERFVDWVPHFSQHKKKDDLADAFLQGNWYATKQQMDATKQQMDATKQQMDATKQQMDATKQQLIKN